MIGFLISLFTQFIFRDRHRNLDRTSGQFGLYAIKVSPWESLETGYRTGFRDYVRVWFLIKKCTQLVVNPVWVVFLRMMSALGMSLDLCILGNDLS